MSGASHEQLEKAFQAMDSDGSGHIDKKELRGLLLKVGCPEQRVEEVLEEILKDDTDKDGKISFDEFMNAMKK